MDTLSLFPIYLATGAISGLLAGLLGIGGGLIMVPALLAGFAIAGVPSASIPEVLLRNNVPDLTRGVPTNELAIVPPSSNVPPPSLTRSLLPATTPVICKVEPVATLMAQRYPDRVLLVREATCKVPDSDQFYPAPLKRRQCLPPAKAPCPSTLNCDDQV